MRSLYDRLDALIGDLCLIALSLMGSFMFSTALTGLAVGQFTKYPESTPGRASYVEAAEPSEPQQTEDHRTDAQRGIYRFNEGETDDDGEGDGEHREPNSDGRHHEPRKLTWKEILDTLLELDARLRVLEKKTGETHDAKTGQT